MSDTPADKIADAVEALAEGEAARADAALEHAEAASTEAISQASLDVATAAQAAAALAETHAATEIQKNKDDLIWLQQHVTETANSLKGVQENQQALVTSLPTLMQQMADNLMTSLEQRLQASSAQKPSNHEETPVEVKPEEQSAAQDAQQAAERKKPKRRNWL